MGSEIDKEDTLKISDLIPTIKFVLEWYFKPSITLLVKIPMFLWMAYLWVFYGIMTFLQGFSIFIDFHPFSSGWLFFALLVINLTVSSYMIAGIPKLWINTDIKKIYKVLLTFGIIVGGTIIVIAINDLRLYLKGLNL
jgi:hypothetical protein